MFAPLSQKAHAESAQSRAQRSQSPTRASLSALPRLAIQPKLTIGKIDDPLEDEADRAADQVMRMPASRFPIGTALSQISRKCAECADEDEKTLRPKPAGPQAAITDAPAIVHQVLGSTGQPFDRASRAFFEPRFGVNFSNVRIHADAQAALSAASVNARAYTVGNHIVLGAGRADSFLLAHELAHVVQQSGGEQKVRRAGEFDIRGVNPETASHPSIIFFDKGEATIPPSEMGKFASLAAPAGVGLTLNGFTSEEGTTGANLGIINARIAAVRAALSAAGHTGPMIANPQPAAGVGQLDYRSVRAVEVVRSGAATATPACQATAAHPHPEDKSCGASFTSAQPSAVTKVNNAIAALTAAQPATKAIFDSVFPGVAQATISARLSALLAQLGVMATATGKKCHNTCDGACSRPGYMTGQGPTAVMTLCPDFIDSFTADERTEMLLHEGMHATVGSPVVDTAYRSQRLIGVLAGSQAETNTDSYVSLILRLQPGAPSVLPGGPPADTVGGGAMSVVEAKAVRRALAFLEKWVEVAEWDTSQLYEAVKSNIGRAGGWNPADEYHAGTQHVIGWLLTLTDPGPTPPYLVTPTKADQVKVAGIHDRYLRMSSAVSSVPIALNKGAASVWAANMGPSVVVDASFFGLNEMLQVVSLLTLLATSMSDVPPGLRSGYADAANQIRWHKGGIGP